MADGRAGNELSEGTDGPALGRPPAPPRPTFAPMMTGLARCPALPAPPDASLPLPLPFPPAFPFPLAAPFRPAFVGFFVGARGVDCLEVEAAGVPPRLEASSAAFWARRWSRRGVDLSPFLSTVRSGVSCRFYNVRVQRRTCWLVRLPGLWRSERD